MTLRTAPTDLGLAGLKAWSRVSPTGRGGYRLVRAVRRFRPRAAWEGRFRVPGGAAMDLDLGVYPDCCMAVGLYELSTRRAMMRRLKPGDHFVDGGANVGYYTMLAAARVGPTGRVDAFEPLPANRERLEAHLRLNGLDGRVCVHPVALGEHAGEAVLSPATGADANHGMGSLFGDAARPGAVAVPVVRLDERLAGTAPTLVKLDLEGGEAAALRGARGLLAATSPPAVVAEYDAGHLARAGETPETLVRAVLDAHPAYACRLLGGNTPIGRDARGLDGHAAQSNLLFSVDAPTERRRGSAA